MGPSSSCSSPGDRSYDGEEYTYTLEIQDEFELDGEVGKRINQLSAVPVSVVSVSISRTLIHFVYEDMCGALQLWPFSCHCFSFL